MSQRLAERVAKSLVPGSAIVAAAIAVVGSLLDDPSLWIERSLVVPVAAAPRDTTDQPADVIAV